MTHHHRSTTLIPSRRRGVSLVYITMAMLALLGFCSFAVDLASVQSAKTQLEIACDAAAHAAALALPSGVSAVQAAAASVAAANTANGKPVTISSTSNVVFLNWPSTTPLTGSARSSANAVKVWATLQVPTLFATALGRDSVTVHASTIAEVTTTTEPYKVGALGSFSMQSSSFTDSYNSGNGDYPWNWQNSWQNTWGGNNGGYGGGNNGGGNNWGSNWQNYWGNNYAGSSSGTYIGNNGSVACNGNFSLDSSSAINGNAWGWGSAPNNCGGTVTGNPAAGNEVTCSTPSAPGGCTNCSNQVNSISNSVTLSSGNYTCSGLTLNSNGTLNINASNGPVNLYCTGNFTCNGGTVNVTGNLPSNFHIYMCNSSSMTIESGCCLHGCIQAPLSNVSLNQSACLCGSCIGNNISLCNGSAIHYDESLGSNGGSVTTTIQVH
jgi:Flp pilus assembly protein TadG